ncbi:MAG: tetratricopeptide repeat protein [Pedosphaera sp.]|nr:tetratricopeptide repeat protein [Pedosphaera sp.]
MSAAKKQPPQNTGKIFLVMAALAVAFPAGVAVYLSTSKLRSRPAPAKFVAADALSAYGKSPSCKSCHEEAFANWEKSHHALAERNLDAAQDKTAFDPARKIHHGTQNSEARLTNDRFELVTTGLDGGKKTFVPARVIAADPLRQFLIPAASGRWQVTELAFDPHKGEWFDVFGDEDRKPGEWGHWTGRGMNWNNMCANCHNTRLQKNYDARTDTYRTAMAEMGVGCEACHGPLANHNAWQTKHPNQSGDPTVRKFKPDQMLSTCGQCHARRAELTGDFHPGENFFDHHQLTIPDETDIFYPDGQVRDEDYEFTAFLGSKMHAAGVRCVNCHEPHTSKLRLPGNLMCMSCHGNVLSNGAPRIDLATHSHHKLDTAGDNCTDCHMPVTTYMQRHPRHDHGFTIPDPRLTKELGIPNACNRCHTNQTPAWSLDAVVKWYGPRTNELVRTRATAIAKARAGDAAAMPMLVKLTETETNFFWRAVAANLLRRWPGETNVMAALQRSAGDTNELVRAMAVRGLEPLAESGVAPVLAALNARLADSVRAVRVEAAWALRHSLDTNSPAGGDLLAYLRHNADQPSGALQLGVFHMDRGDLATALDYFRRAVAWDTNSAPLHHALAVALSADGKSAEAVTALQTACRLAPRDAEYRYKLGLALNDVGKLDAARVALEEAVKLEPQFARAWYNLGLAFSAQEKTSDALNALIRAESLEPNSAQIPYARATILARLGRVEEARTAAARAVELNRGFSEARQLLQSLGR